MAAIQNLPSGLVTFLFTDIEGSTRLARMLGDGYRPVLRAHRSLLRRTLGKRDGAELLTQGDSFFVAFADATSALHACADAQRALAEHQWPSATARPLVRMGLHTGYAVPHAGEYASHEVHRAARVAAAAHGGQVLCSQATAVAADGLPDGARLVDLGLYRLRGFDDRERLHQLVAPGLTRYFPRPRTPGAAVESHNLPLVPTSFVGRVAERVELRGLIGTHRLVTVCGPGGAGKTRLAATVAGELVDAYPDGIWFVDLATVTDPALVPVTVAAGYGLRPEPGRPVVETLADCTRDRRCLLLLDTCDHQRAATASLVRRLLSTSGGITVLATSREPLGLPGEVVWRIPPLSTAPRQGGPSEAVALLQDRAAAARGGQQTGTSELGALERVARRLDGLPLALELAAARLRVLSADQLAERLDDVIGTLDAGRPAEGDPDGRVASAWQRHATLRATVDWSYRTLDPAAAKLLRWLAVFRGPVDLAAVEWLVREDPLGPLAVLVDKSLVLAERSGPDGGAMYRMLDPIRAYAERRLVEVGEEEAARNRHVAWCLDAVDRSRVDGEGREVTFSLYSIDALAGEVRGALHWTASGGCVRYGLRLVRMLDQWWRERCTAREGRLWLNRLYERMGVTGEAVPGTELADTYHVHSLLAGADGEYAEELRFSQRAEVAARHTGDAGLLARVMGNRGGILVGVDDTDGAEAICRDTIEAARRAGVPADALFSVYFLAALLWRRGELAEAADLLASARPLESEWCASRGRRTVDFLLGLVALSRGDLVAAHDHLVVALRSRMAHGFHSRVIEALAALAVRCTLGGQGRDGAKLFGAADAHRRRLRASFGGYRQFIAEHQALARAQLGDAMFDRCYAEGASMSLDEAVAAALDVEHPDLVTGSESALGAGAASGQPPTQRVNGRLSAGSVCSRDAAGRAR